MNTTFLSGVVKRLERFTKTDIRYLLRGGFWLSIGRVLSAFSAFLVSVAFANLLPQETYGTYRFILSIAGVLSAFTLPAMSTALIRAVARGMDGSVHQATGVRIKVGALGALIALGIGLYYFIQGNYVLATANLIVAMFLPFFDTFTIINAYLQGKRDFRKDTVCDSIVKIIATGILVATAFLTTNLYFLLIAYFGSYTVLRAITYFYIVRSIPKKSPVDPEMVTYGTHLSVMGLSGLIATHIDKILLFQHIGAVEVALYAVATAIPENARSAVKSFSILLTPKFAKDSSEEIANRVASLWRKMILIGGVLVLATLAYIPLAPFLYGTLFPTYPDAVLLSQVSMIGLVTGISAIPMMLLQSQKKTGPLYGLVGVNTFIQLGLLFVLVPLFGVWGAIWGRIISGFITTATNLALLGYLYRTY